MSARLFAVTPPAETADVAGIRWDVAELGEVNDLLAARHYLGPIRSGGRILFGGWNELDVLVAAQVWRHPTSRHLPQDGSWLELSRWCLTPDAGQYAGSRMHKRVARVLRLRFPNVTTLVSYSDPSQGHTGALYRACNWYWAPTWLRLRPPPTGNGDWGNGRVQSPKDRWVFDVTADARRAAILAPDDAPAVRRYVASEEWAKTTSRWAVHAPRARGSGGGCMTTSHNTDSVNRPTDWVRWVHCDIHRLEHPKDPPGSPCVNPVYMEDEQ